MQRYCAAVGLMVVVLLSSATARSAPIDGPWVNATGQGDGPLSWSPGNLTVGNGSANSADGEMVSAVFSAITLATAGDYVSFTGDVQLTGTVNSPATSGTPRTQFRFGVFDSDNDDLGWVGYYMSNKHGNAGTPAGVLAEKPTGNTSTYLSATGQTALTSEQGDGTAASLFNDSTYSMTITITRTVADELTVQGILTSTNGFSQNLTATDVTPGTFTFDAVGFLLGGNLDADQGTFSNLAISTNVPEPTSLIASAGLGIAMLMRRRGSR